MRSFAQPITLLLAGAALLAAVPALGLAPLLQYDRAAVAAGQWYRLLTCHWTHWSGEHLLWDVLVFAAAGAMCERRDRSRFIACVAASAVVISLGVFLLMPHLQTYRGLSGIDSAAFALLVTDLIQQKARRREWNGLLMVILLAGSFAAKTAYELTTGATLFVADTTFSLVPLAHIAGAITGAAMRWRVALPTSSLAPDAYATCTDNRDRCH